MTEDTNAVTPTKKTAATREDSTCDHGRISTGRKDGPSTLREFKKESKKGFPERKI